MRVIIVTITILAGAAMTLLLQNPTHAPCERLASVIDIGNCVQK